MKKTPLLRYVLVLLIATLACACERKEVKQGSKATATVGASTIKKLQPWETVHEGFNGCAGGCGMRVAGPTEGVIAQPGAMIGQRVYCPVSGVAFEVKPTTAQRVVGDMTLYFCCESCAGYFMTNQTSILAARGIRA